MAVPHVVIIGAGFAGLYAAKALAGAPVRLTVLDRRNHHLFQPLLYQVATAMLSPANIAEPIRRVLRHQRNASVLLGEARAIEVDARRVVLADGEVGYDTLILATGATHSYFGHDEWARFAPGLKTVEDAVEIRRRFLLAFEAAERESDAAARRAELTFVVVGAGPTGVELAGSMTEIARRAIPRDFRAVDTATARVILVEAGDRVLSAFSPDLSERARRDLEKLGVEVRLNTKVTDIDASGAKVGDQRIPARNVIWAAGVRASELGASLGAPLDHAGRVNVGPDLTIPGHPEVFVLGDLANITDERTGKAVPGISPAAIQMGRYAGRIVAREAEAARRGKAAPPRPPFSYRDKGILATIGRNKAVAMLPRAEFGGYFAWALWALVHVFFLIGFRNRLLVMLEWAWAYLVFDRGARLITGDSRVRLGPERR